MTQITSQTLKTMRPQIEDALKELGERLGIDFKLGRGTYNGSGVNGSFALEMAARDAATGKSGAQVLFERLAPRYGLTAEDYGREFTYQRTRYKLVGINPKSPVNCLSVARVKDDKEFVISIETYTFARTVEDALLNKKAA
jgi:hypothetical protein